MDIKLPLGENTSWTYKYPSDSSKLRIDKKVIGYEKITINGNDYFCFVIYWDYLNDARFKGVEVTDWISKQGLIKRQTVYDRFQWITLEGDSVANSFYWIETLTIKDIKIN